jgi:hypothetical protein
MFDPRRPEAIAAKIGEVLRDPAFAARLRTHGRTQAARFSWDNTAQRALRALESLAGTGAPVRPRAREALLQTLAGMPDLAADDATLLALASSLASLPNPAAPRQLLIDVSGLNDAQPLRELMQASPAGMQTVPVFLSAQGGVWHYRYARRHANDHVADPVADMRVADMRVADLRTGDILVCPCADRHALEAAVADGLFDHLHRNGITLHLAADDPLSANVPAWMGRLVALADDVRAGDPAWPAIEALIHARTVA